VWVYIKENVFVPPLPAGLEEPQARTIEAVASIEADVIHRIWDEIADRWDIRRVTTEIHTEHP